MQGAEAAPAACDVTIDLDGLVDEMSAAKLEVDRYVKQQAALMAGAEEDFTRKSAQYEGKRAARWEVL